MIACDKCHGMIGSGNVHVTQATGAVVLHWHLPCYARIEPEPPTGAGLGKAPGAPDERPKARRS